LFAANDACPSFRQGGSKNPGAFYQIEQTRNFVEKVLHTKQEK